MTTQRDVDEAYASVVTMALAHELAWEKYSDARHAFVAARKAETEAGKAVARAIERHAAALNALGASHED